VASPVTTESLTLRRFDFSDTSQVAHLLTRSSGRLNALAKGIKRSKRAAIFDLFSHGRLTFLPRPSGQLQLVTEYDAIATFPAIRASLPRLHAALYFLELAIEIVPEGEPNAAAFDTLLSGLRGLEAEAPASAPALVLSFELEFLSLGGFAPRAGSCLSCGKDVGRAPEPFRFSPGEGGFLCRDCFAARGPKPALAAPVARAALKILESLSRRETRAGERMTAPKLPDGAIPPLRSLMDAHVRATIEKDLKTARFLPRR